MFNVTQPPDTVQEATAREFAKPQKTIERKVDIEDPRLILGRNGDKLDVNGNLTVKMNLDPVEMISLLQKGYGPNFSWQNFQTMLRLRTKSAFGPDVVAEYINFKRKDPFGIIRAGLNAKFKFGRSGFSFSYLPITKGINLPKEPQDEVIINANLGFGSGYGLNGFCRFDPEMKHSLKEWQMKNMRYGLELTGKSEYVEGSIGYRSFPVNGKNNGQLYASGKIPLTKMFRKK